MPTHPAHDHDHAHGGHDHSHAGHTHAPSADADRRWLTVALALIAGFMVVEVVAGLLAGSLALLSDAAHMLTDAAAIGLALVAARLAARPPRAPSPSASAAPRSSRAQINGAALLVLAGVIAFEAVGRLGSTRPTVEGGLVIVVGVVGGAGQRRRRLGARRAPSAQSLNVEGARAARPGRPLRIGRRGRPPAS